MALERLNPAAVNGVSRNLKHRELVEEQTRPTFEIDGPRRVYRHPEFSYYPDYLDGKGIIIMKSGRRIGLTPRENSIFIKLAENASQVISHQTIGISDDLLRQYFGKLKRKIQPLPEDPQIIYSIGGKRYILQDQSRLEDGKRFSGFVYRDKRHSVEVANNEALLTIREKKLLDFLIKHIDKVVEKDAIVKALYEDKESTTQLRLQRRVYKCIQGLREKIGDSEQEDGTFRFIVGVHGKGYKLTDPAYQSA
mgnify:CR=1 FL=1